MTYQEFIKGPEAQRRYWAPAHMDGAACAEPSPTPVTMVADMERDGRLDGLITQNVDGLHGRAGHRSVIDLHGRSTG